MSSVQLYCPSCRRLEPGHVTAHPLDHEGVCTGCLRRWPRWRDVPCFLAEDLGELDLVLQRVANAAADTRAIDVADALDAADPTQVSLATWAQAGWGHRALPPLPHTPSEWLEPWFAALPPGPVLVAGCATGAEAVRLSATRDEVWALEAAAWPVVWARRLADANQPLPYRRDALRLGQRPLALRPDERGALQRLRWVVADIFDPPFMAETFAAVVMLNLLDAVAEPLGLLGQAEALLRPGGVLLTSSPYHFQTAVTPEADGLRRWLPPDRPLTEGVVQWFAGGEFELFPDLVLEQHACEVPWRIHAHPGFSADYSLHIMRLRKRR
jgi:SAM-dependent methyltransferase